MVPRHKRTSLSDFILVSYHLFSQTHDHHFVQLDRLIAQLGSDLYVMCFRCLASILWRTLEGFVCGSGTPKSALIGLCPGESWLWK